MSDLAIRFDKVGKRYPIFRSALSETFVAVGFRSEARAARGYFDALRDLTFDVYHGERVAIIGRNGAGKSTLLKIVSGTLQPSSGRVEVYGKVSALFDLGVGFHDEFTGYDNIRSSLAYNDFSKVELNRHIDDIIDFCELGEYLHQPVKTYSAGMKARLYFSVASAIEPDVLIVDEVLGAGDGYFGVKSAERIARVTGGGTTLLLVSHNLAQIRQMCKTAIWIEQGEIQIVGPVDSVVARYEEFITTLERDLRSDTDATPANNWLDRQITLTLSRLGGGRARPLTSRDFDIRLENRTGRVLSCEFINALDDFETIVVIESPLPGSVVEGRPAVAVFTEDCRLIDLCLGPQIEAVVQAEPMRLEAAFRPLRLGPGTYVLRPLVVAETSSGKYVTTSIGRKSTILEVHSTDLSETSLFLHPAEWSTL